MHCDWNTQLCVQIDRQRAGGLVLWVSVAVVDGVGTRAFQFGLKSFDSIRFANLINLPLLH